MSNPDPKSSENAPNMRIRHVQIGESLTDIYRPSYGDGLLHNLFKTILSLIKKVPTYRKP